LPYFSGSGLIWAIRGLQNFGYNQMIHISTIAVAKKKTRVRYYWDHSITFTIRRKTGTGRKMN